LSLFQAILVVFVTVSDLLKGGGSALIVVSEVSLFKRWLGHSWFRCVFKRKVQQFERIPL